MNLYLLRDSMRRDRNFNLGKKVGELGELMQDVKLGIHDLNETMSDFHTG